MTTRQLYLQLALVSLLVGACKVDPYTLGGNDDDGGGINDDGGSGDDGGGGVIDAGIVYDAPLDACVPSIEVCDGEDNDCDGVPDNGFNLDLDPDNCGTCGNRCDRLNMLGTCDDGECVYECQPGWEDVDPDVDGCEYWCTKTNGGVEACDGADNDCDGEFDEDFDLTDDVNNCGACNRKCQALHALAECVDSVCVYECEAGYGDSDPSTPACDYACPVDPQEDESCNGVDDDCDTLVDVPNCRSDEVGGAGDICDDADHNLDQTACEAEVGCHWQALPQVGDACGTGLGECSQGVKECLYGSVQCVGQVGPSVDICDYKDNDCDGTPDQGFPELGTTCSNSQLGACYQEGVWECRPDGLSTVCTAPAGTPTTETCNNIDDDCNGLVDGIVVECYTADTGCPDGVCQGECRMGTTTCTAGEFGDCLGERGPTPEVCNKLDDDCNGTPDDGDPGGGASCGSDVGLCVPGVEHCVDGGVVCVGAVGPTPDFCDGEDNDCDGDADEDYTDLGDTCDNGMQGACYQTGVKVCRADHKATVCTAVEGTPTPEVCDGIDNDCNGVVDHIVEQCYTGTSGCPGGVCEGECRMGSRVCNDTTWEACIGDNTPQQESCNGLDDDCDGEIDEPNCLDDGAGAVCGDASHMDDQTVCEAEAGCRWGLPGIGGTCTDPGYEANGDTGECQYGTVVCTDGAPVCEGYVKPVRDICDGLDNDCDGASDEDYTDLGADCNNGMQGACYQTGTKVCRADHLGTVCTAVPGTPTTEICDGIDNDCNGVVDHLVEQCYTGTSGCPGGVCEGECRMGTHSCVVGPGWGSCIGEITPQLEVCNGLDDDCDGSIDEPRCVDNGGGATCEDASHIDDQTACEAEAGCSWTLPGVGVACTDPGYETEGDTGECAFGATICSGGSLVCSGYVGPTTDLCDGLDNDCDGTPDEGYTDLGDPCNNGMQGACYATGIKVCRDDFLGTRCTALPGTPSPEVCDGIDNDCNGVVDHLVEACYTGGTGCSGGVCVGECQMGTRTCTDGPTWNPCVGEVTPQPEVCNGLNDDCDAETDEGTLPGVGDPCTDPGYELIGDTGECDFGAKICSGGSLVCSGYIGPKTDVCDGLDNDCDGTADQGFPDLGTVCDNGELGACNESGHKVCRVDKLATVCDAPDGTPAEETCNNIDDDCNGVVDGFTEACYTFSDGCVIGTGCDGRCRTGTSTCTAGVPGPCNGEIGPDPAGESCNNIDDDCDGATDENRCVDNGGGAICEDAAHNAGQAACEVDAGCMWGLPGVGDPCTDPGFETEGDTGECEFGAKVCTAGALVCNGYVGPTTDVCDTLDNDCDGSADEDYQTDIDPNHCGPSCTVCNFLNAVNGCHDLGSGGECYIISCLPGWVNADLDDEPGDVLGCEYECTYTGDEVCDGQDNDCDTYIDEAPGVGNDPSGIVVPVGLTCNSTGPCNGTTPSCTTTACNSTPAWHCVYGSDVETDNCGNLLLQETKCDDLDGDCDGDVDETYPEKVAAADCGEDGKVGICQGTGYWICDPSDPYSLSCFITVEGLDPLDHEDCNNLDDNCNGEVDELYDPDLGTFIMSDTMITVPAGTTSSGVVVPAFQIDAYEASRPDAAADSSGSADHMSCSNPDVLPWRTVTHQQAADACAAAEKRLCTEDEWQRACEGTEPGGGWPNNYKSYPYGETYDEYACNGWDFNEDCSPAANTFSLYSSGKQYRDDSGGMCLLAPDTCYSEYGAYDMSGNVQEWTSSVISTGPDTYRVRGGTFQTQRGGLTCQHAFIAFDDTISFPSLGFRCCKDIP